MCLILTIRSAPRHVMPSRVKGTSFEKHTFFERSSIRKLGSTYYFIYSSTKSHELCYLFGMHGDSVTPPRHLLAFACALEKANVPFELHMFRGKGHGLSLGTSLTSAGFASDVNADYAMWLPMSVRWLRDVFGDFTLYGCNDGRTGKFHIDRTVSQLFSEEEARKICMERMPVLTKFAEGDAADEMTPRRINSFMTVLSAEALEELDRALLTL